MGTGREDAIFCDDSGREVMRLKATDLKALFLSSEKIGVAHDIECDYDAFVSAFIEFKSLVFKKTLESSRWPLYAYQEAHEARVFLNLSLAAVLNAGKSLTDKLQGADKSSILNIFNDGFGKKSSPKAIVSSRVKGEYDNNDYYLLMYTARNYLQHNGVVIDNIKRQMGPERHDGYVESKLSLMLDVNKLKQFICATPDSQSKQNKLSRFEKIQSGTHLMVALESYVSSVHKIIKAFRGAVRGALSNERNVHKTALENIGESKLYSLRFAKWGGRPVPCSLEWDLTETLSNKNSNPPVNMGNLLFTLDYGRKEGCYDRFYESVGLTPPK